MALKTYTMQTADGATLRVTRKTKQGAPKKSADILHDRINITVSKQGRRIAAEKARAAGMSVSAWYDMAATLFELKCVE